MIDATLSEDNKNKALILAEEVDVAIFATYGVFEYERKRLETGKLTFEYGERWLKRGLINLLSPRLIKHQLLYYLLDVRQQTYVRA